MSFRRLKGAPLPDDREPDYETASNAGSVASVGSLRSIRSFGSSLNRRFDRFDPFRRSAPKTSKLPRNLPQGPSKTPGQAIQPPRRTCDQIEHILCRVNQDDRRWIATADPDLLTFEYLRNKCENETPANYIANGYLPGHRRETLFVLITEWTESLEYRPETAHLACQIFDQFMSTRYQRDPDKSPIEDRIENFASKFSLIAFWLATKFLERYPALIDDLQQWGSNRFSPRTLKDAEIEMYSELDWNVSFPVAYDFTRFYCHKAFPDDHKFMSKLAALRYLTELAVFNPILVDKAQSTLVAGALNLLTRLLAKGLKIGSGGSSKTTRPKKWAEVESIIGHSGPEDVKTVAEQTYRQLYRLSQTPKPLPANNTGDSAFYLYDKYCCAQFGSEVSKIIDQFVAILRTK